MSETIVKRLHISGLTPQFTQDALRERLSTYGEVVDMEGLHDAYVDGVGLRRPYAFATLRTTPPQLAKCMNTLSGAVWKGAKLRVGEAKPRWHERLATERAKVANEDALAQNVDIIRRRLRKRPWIGMEAHDMRPVTRERVNDGGEWGWKVTPAGHLVRPMHMRPARPIPRPADAEARGMHRVVRRLPRVTIDPTRYTREHLAGRIFEGPGAHVRWVWDDDAREWKGFERGVCVDTDAGPRERRPIEPAMPADVREDTAWEEADVPDTLFEQDSSVSDDLFDAPPTAHAGQWWDEEAQTQPVIERTDPLDDADSDGYDEMAHADVGGDERARAMAALRGLFGDSYATGEGKEPESVHAEMGTVPDDAGDAGDAGDADMVDLDDGTQGAQDTAETAERTPEETASVAVEPTSASASASAPATAPVHMDSLKSMFQPSEDTGALALFGSLVDEDELDVDALGLGESSVPASASAAAPAPAPALAQAPQAAVHMPPMTTPATLAMATPSLLPALFQRGAAPFWQVASHDEVDAHWRATRADLTQTYRQMHRDAVKKRRRRVVGSRAGVQHGGVAPVRGAMRAS